MSQSDTIVRGIQSISDAADVIARHHRLSSEVVIEYYPARPRSFALESESTGVFAYQFFDTAGGNCGYYLVDLDSVHVLSTPRHWGIPKSHVGRINPVRPSFVSH